MPGTASASEPLRAGRESNMVFLLPSTWNRRDERVIDRYGHHGAPLVALAEVDRLALRRREREAGLGVEDRRGAGRQHDLDHGAVLRRRRRSAVQTRRALPARRDRACRSLAVRRRPALCLDRRRGAADVMRRFRLHASTIDVPSSPPTRCSSKHDVDELDLHVGIIAQPFAALPVVASSTTTLPASSARRAKCRAPRSA